MEILEQVDPWVDDPGFVAALMRATDSRLPQEEWSWVLEYGDLCLGQRGAPRIQLVVQGSI